MCLGSMGGEEGRPSCLRKERRFSQADEYAIKVELA